MILWINSTNAGDRGELLVRLPDRLGVAPRLQVQPEPAHVLKVRCHLLLGRQGARASFTFVLGV